MEVDLAVVVAATVVVVVVAVFGGEPLFGLALKNEDKKALSERSRRWLIFTAKAREMIVRMMKVDLSILKRLV